MAISCFKCKKVWLVKVSKRNNRSYRVQNGRYPLLSFSAIALVACYLIRNIKKHQTIYNFTVRNQSSQSSKPSRSAWKDTMRCVKCQNTSSLPWALINWLYNPNYLLQDGDRGLGYAMEGISPAMRSSRMAHLPEYDALLVADVRNRRILTINSRNGSVIE